MKPHKHRSPPSLAQQGTPSSGSKSPTGSASDKGLSSSADDNERDHMFGARYSDMFTSKDLYLYLIFYSLNSHNCEVRCEAALN